MSLGRAFEKKNEKLETLKSKSLKLETSTQTFSVYSAQFHFEFSNLKVSNFPFFPIVFSNYMHPLVWFHQKNDNTQ